MKMSKKNTKGTQKTKPMMVGSIVPLPYETAIGMSNTEEVKKDKKDRHVQLDSCKCSARKNNNIDKPARTWESINKLYGDADTTQVWDDQEYKPRPVFSSKLHKQEYPKVIIDQSEISDVMYPTSKLKKSSENLSLIGLHRKHKNNENKRKIDQSFNENSKNTGVRFSPYTEPELKFMSKKKPEKGLKDHYDNRVLSDLICSEGPCRETIENLYNLHGLKYTLNRNKKVTKSGNNDNSKKTKTPTKENKIIKNLKNKQTTGMKGTKDEHVGYGDQISSVPVNKKDLKDIRRKSSFIWKMMGDAIFKCKNNNGLFYYITKENKIMKNSKNKQAKAINSVKNSNFGNGDQSSPVPLNKQVLKNIRRNSSFFGKMLGHTYNNGNTLQTSSNDNNDNSNREKTKTITKENKIMKKSRNKQAKAINTAKNGNFGNGDQISPVPLTKQDLKDILLKSSFFEKMLGRTYNNGSTLKTSSNINNLTGEPLLEMKVNLEDMRVINSSEVNEKIKKLGRTQKKNLSCICPSHINYYRVCKRGLCEQALENKHIDFDCKCRKKNIIECSDSMCDLNIPDIKVKSRKKKRPKSPVYTENNKPLFEVMLDPTNRNIINSHEIKDIVTKAFQNKKICPTGICNTMSKDRNVLLNCKCVGRKITPFVKECEDRTCRKKKCKLSYLCSRIFSKSENWIGQKQNRRRRPIRANRHITNVETNNYIARSHTPYKKNGVVINLPRSRKQKKGLLGTYGERRLLEIWSKGEDDPKPKKPSVKKQKKVSKRRRRREAFFKKNKIDDRTLTEKFLDCFDKGQEECEKRVEKKTKEYKKKEKLAIKENKEIEAEQKEFYRTQQHRTSCLRNFISGALNVSFETVKVVIKIPFSILGDPIGSFVYVREKMKDPPEAMLRVFSWFSRAWGNKSSSISRAIDDSTTLNVIADTLENSAAYDALMNMKGRTPEEKLMYERRKMLRQRRIQKRQDQALYGCKHILLTTMRKTPCLWCYHICPDMYPQCLNFISFMNNFIHLLLYCGAIMCWTPCIVAFEICRGFMCCLLCTH